MTGTHAMNPPWAAMAGAFGLRQTQMGDLLAAMTGHRGHRPRHGAPPWAAPWASAGPMPFAPPWAGGGRGWRGPKARRGDVRAAILGLIAEEPMNGYQLIQAIAARSHGAWKPSPGSVYPTLQQLEDEGLVEASGAEGRRTFSLTEAGRTYVADHTEEIEAPWQEAGEWGMTDDALRPLIGQVASAVWQVMSTGTRSQQEQAREALTDLKRTLYTILAGDGPDKDRS